MKNKETGPKSGKTILQEKPITRETLKKRREKMSAAQERREKKRQEIFEKMRSEVHPTINRSYISTWRERLTDAHENVILERKCEDIPEAVRKQSREAGLLKEAEKLMTVPQKGPTNWMIDKFLAYITRKIVDFGSYNYAKGRTFLPASYVVKPWSYADNKMIVTISIKDENAVEVPPIVMREDIYEKELMPLPKKRGRPRIARPGEYISTNQDGIEKLRTGLYVLMEDGRVLLKKTPKKRKVVAPDNHKKHVEGLKEILKVNKEERKVNADKSNKLSSKKKIKVQKKKPIVNNKR